MLPNIEIRFCLAVSSHVHCGPLLGFSSRGKKKTFELFSTTVQDVYLQIHIFGLFEEASWHLCCTFYANISICITGTEREIDIGKKWLFFTFVSPIFVLQHTAVHVTELPFGKEVTAAVGGQNEIRLI